MRQRKTVALGMSYVCVFACGLTVGMFAISGCGGDEGTKDDSASDDAVSDGGETGSTGGSDSPKVAKNGTYVDEDGRKWLAKDFPYDVWYTNPLAVAKQEGKVPDPGVGNPGTTPENGGTKTTDPMPASDSGSGEINWKEVIAASVLDEEIKKINNRFRAKLQTVATFNSSYLELPPHVTTMAALSAIAAQHPDEVRWKKNANQIRDLSASMLTEKLQRGPKSYKQMNEPYLNIGDILSGSPPGGLAEPNEDGAMVEYVDIGFLMKRIEIGTKWMQVNVGSEEALMENADDIKHEAALLGALLTVTMTEGYGYEEDDDFKAFAKGMMDGCKKVTEAVGTGNLENYQLGFPLIDQACTKCHGTYR